MLASFLLLGSLAGINASPNSRDDASLTARNAFTCPEEATQFDELKPSLKEEADTFKEQVIFCVPGLANARFEYGGNDFSGNNVKRRNSGNNVETGNMETTYHQKREVDCDETIQKWACLHGLQCELSALELHCSLAYVDPALVQHTFDKLEIYLKLDDSWLFGAGTDDQVYVKFGSQSYATAVLIPAPPAGEQDRVLVDLEKTFNATEVPTNLLPSISIWSEPPIDHPGSVETLGDGTPPPRIVSDDQFEVEGMCRPVTVFYLVWNAPFSTFLLISPRFCF